MKKEEEDELKFSEITSKDWEELQPYLDTCLIPYTGLTGQESPHEAVAALERLRDLLDYVEIPFKGRVVTYPAVHYSPYECENMLNNICAKIKSGGFKHVIVLSCDHLLDHDHLPEADLLLSLQRWVPETADDISLISRGEIRELIQQQVYQMWS